MQSAHSQYVLQILSELSKDLSLAVASQNPQMASLTIKLLAVLEPELHTFENGKTAVNSPIKTDAPKRFRSKGALTDRQIALFDVLLCLNGQQRPASLLEAVQILHSAEAGNGTASTQSKAYHNTQNDLRHGLRKIERILLAGMIGISLLPKNNQSFFRRLLKKYPGKNIEDIKEQACFGKKKAKKIPVDERKEEQPPFLA